MKKINYLLFLPGLVLANENLEQNNYLDRFNETIYNLNLDLNRYTKNIDEFLVNEYNDDIYDKSYIRFENKFIYNKYENFEYEPSFILRVKLPKLQKRFSLEIDNTDDNIEQKFNDTNEKVQFKDNTNNDYNVGLIYKRLSKSINTDFKTGVKLSTNPYIYIKTSAYKTFELDEYSNILIKEEIKFSDKYKLDNSFIIQYQNQLNDKYSFTYYNEYFINSERKDDEIYNSLRLTKNINDKEYLNYVLSINSNNIESDLEIKEYRFYTSYRKYFKQWLYLDVVPSISLEEKYSFNINPGIMFNLGIYIGK